MKTPDEIKKGLELCSIGNMRECMKCPYPIGFECFEQPMKDSLAYIQQLESRLAQVERERDAAVADMRMAFRRCNVCCCCKHEDGESNDCMDCIGSCNWQWRGVCPENTKEVSK